MTTSGVAPGPLDLAVPPALELHLFPGGPSASSTPDRLAWSDDARLLAVTSEASEVVVVDGDTACERYRSVQPTPKADAAHPSFVFGTHLLLTEFRACYEAPVYQAFDLDTGAAAPVPAVVGRVRSTTGRWVARFGDDDTESTFGPGAVVIEGEGGVNVVQLPTGHVKHVCFAPADRAIFVAGSSGSYVFSRATGALERELATGADEVRRLACSPDGEWLAVATGDTLQIRRVGDDSVVEQRWLNRLVADLAWSPDGCVLAVGIVEPRGGGVVRLYAGGGDRSDLAIARSARAAAKAMLADLADFVRASFVGADLQEDETGFVGRVPHPTAYFHFHAVQHGNVVRLRAAVADHRDVEDSHYLASELSRIRREWAKLHPSLWFENDGSVFYAESWISLTEPNPRVRFATFVSAASDIGYMP